MSASEWKPPKMGSPVWIDIASHDKTRAHKFYSTVFNWEFKPPTAADTEGGKAPEFIKFDFNPDVTLSGCIRDGPDKTGNLAPGRGGICLYWLVEDVEKIGDVIDKAGGKMLSGAEKEGEYGLYRFFEDTEGNLGAVYQLKT
ncbi:hypothetical protein OQA88_7022 [Cercophora sp. LCS_1]